MFAGDEIDSSQSVTKIIWAKEPKSQVASTADSSNNEVLIKQRITPYNVTSLKENEVFVFGSNTAGIHDGGASECALEMFGAIMGQAYGPQGRSYAIPTDGPDLQEIAVSILGFISYAKNNPDKTFLVTAIGCGSAGYSVREIS